MDRRERQQAAAPFHRGRRSPILAFAGLWDRWRDHAAGEDVLSCTIIVCGANKWMQAYHDRMPVILDEKDFDGWLDGSRVLAPSNARRNLRFVNG
jgi:putative SOS response-associated peptidase YedK